MYSIKSLRGTIFCPPVKYTKEFVDRLAGIIDGYLPIIVRDSNSLPILPVWQLSSPDEKELLAFNGEKIDLIQIVESKIGDEQIQAFCERCKIVFGKILEVMGFVCTRMALAPSVIVTENGVRPEGLYNRLFNIREFDQVQLESSNLSQVYRIEKLIGDSSRLINHVANFKAENELVTTSNGNQLRQRYICDFDINTMPLPEYRFALVEIGAFFGMAPAMFASFFGLYFA